jgi:hypothetical protein
MKLKVNELRIGNLVQRTNKHTKEKFIYELTASCILDIYANGERSSFIYKPIPITEVFLLENGFKEKRYEYTIPISDCGLVTLTLIPHDEFPADCSVCVSQKDGHNEDEIEKVFLSEIKYVHQLQNLFYALTNKEQQWKK